MKKRIFGGLTLAGMLLTQVLAAGPGMAAPQTITKTRAEGEGVVAHFRSTDASGCVRTNLSVVAIEETGDGAETLATVSMSQFNACLGVNLIAGFGATTDFDMVVANSLNNASLTMNLTIANSVNKTQLPLTFDASWSAVASTDTLVTRDKFTVDGVTFFATNQFRERPSRSVATVTLGGETLFESHPSIDANIARGFERAMAHGEDIDPG